MSIIDELVTGRSSGTFYNVSDLNRVAEAMDWLADQLFALGYQCRVSPKTDWTKYDIPLALQMEYYLEDLRTIRDTLTLPVGTPDAPNTMNSLTYTGANNIETILSVTNALMEWMVSVFYFAGDLYTGEVQ